MAWMRSGRRARTARSLAAAEARAVRKTAAGRGARLEGASDSCIGVPSTAVRGAPLRPPRDVAPDQPGDPRWPPCPARFAELPEHLATTSPSRRLEITDP